jgi:LysM repeat protein
MTEGGLFPWKLQKIWTRGPTADYSNLRDPLPNPPADMAWHQDKETKEWKLVKEQEDQVEGHGDQDEKVEPELAEESERNIMVDTLPPLPPSSSRDLPQNQLLLHNYNEDEWELLSDRVSCSSNGGGMIFVSRAGSVRSISSMEGQEHHSSAHSGSHTTLSVPFKIQRTTSSSTLDSTDNVLGPSGKGVLGVDYVEHVILPTDTLQGICLAYKISSTRLRQANHFSGNSLLLAPKKLVIPLSKKALRSGFIRVQDTDAKEYKLHAFLAEFADLSLTEAKA